MTEDWQEFYRYKKHNVIDHWDDQITPPDNQLI